MITKWKNAIGSKAVVLDYIDKLFSIRTSPFSCGSNFIFELLIYYLVKNSYK